MGIHNRSLEKVFPGPDGNYREWVRYRVWEEFKYFLSANHMNLEACAELFWGDDGKELETPRGVTKLRNWLYLHSDIRNPTMEDLAFVELKQRQLGDKLLRYLDINYIITGQRATRKEDELSLKVKRLESENMTLKNMVGEQQTLLREYQRIVGNKVKE